ncbi:hypothetical protein OSB04_000731 [Centaurea solstitialis]|uniref:RRM domain-containing protein n=1 Tax=Centaurea solstitialis TaxID=347529 RepID=A0AA38TPN1_9ASTR|nr:hypothetical protein OSB04_000731 [Centaurea solstitialis]
MRERVERESGWRGRGGGLGGSERDRVSSFVRLRGGHRSEQLGYRGGFEDSDVKRGRFRNEISFLFFNFPENVEVPELWRTFKRLGEATDIYIARKRLRNGKKFGFIRFKDKGNAMELLGKLSNVWFGFFKLVVYLAEKGWRGMLDSRNRSSEGQAGLRGVPPIREGAKNRSYKEAVCNGKPKEVPSSSKLEEEVEVPNDDEDFKEVSFGSWAADESNMKFLQNCLVGSIGSMDNFEAVAKLVSSIWPGSKLKYLGGKKILIHVAGENFIREVEGNARHGIHFWVKNLCRWSEAYREVERITWLKISGVSLHVWKEEVFTSIASKWGQVLKSHNCDLLEDSVLNEGRVQICTPIRTPIHELGYVKIGYLFYRIVVSEDEEGPVLLEVENSEANDSDDERADQENSENQSDWSMDSDGSFVNETGESGAGPNGEAIKEKERQSDDLEAEREVQSAQRGRKEGVGEVTADKAGEEFKGGPKSATEVVPDGRRREENPGGDLGGGDGSGIPELRDAKTKVGNEKSQSGLGAQVDSVFNLRPNLEGEKGTVCSKPIMVNSGSPNPVVGANQTMVGPNSDIPLKENFLEKDNSSPSSESINYVGTNQTRKEGDDLRETIRNSKGSGGCNLSTEERVISSSIKRRGHGQKAKARRSYSMNFGRGKVSFHLMKKQARSIGRKEASSRDKGDSNCSLEKNSRRVAKEKDKEARVSKKAVSNELGGKSSDNEIREFGGMIGVDWKGPATEGVEGARQWINGLVGLVNVYGPNSITERKELWKKLRTIISNEDIKWCVFGDFNEVRSKEERLNSTLVQRGVDDFNDFIEESGLVEIPMFGRRYTRISDDGIKLSKLDRFLTSQNFGWCWKNLGVKAVERSGSDHTPLVLGEDKTDFGPKPFKFFDAWLKEESLEPVVREAWSHESHSSEPDRVLRDKLKFVKQKIKEWSKEKFGSLDKKLEDARNECNRLENKAEEVGWTETERGKWLESRKLCLDLEEKKGGMLRQKAKLRWLTEGDENSKYFHATLKHRERKNTIRGLEINGEWVEDPKRVSAHIADFFKNKFSSDHNHRPKFESAKTKTLSREEAEFLEEPFGEDEVWLAIKDCGSNKSPGPDGFTMGFVKKFWGILKEDFMKAIRWFWESESLGPGCNSSFITLIPKVVNPCNISEFRPISLIGVFYKVVAKVLAHRLKRVIGKVISDQQSAFIKGRNILDGVLVANEVVDFIRGKKRKGLIFKVDFEKAYDSVNWNFLLDTLRRMGFRDKWIRWISTCLRSSHVSVLVNGAPSKEFVMGRGLRQGDPLAPFLFLIASENLNLLMEEAKEKGLYEGLKIGQNDIEISHLQYADDAIFFGKWCLRNLKNLLKILECFRLISGLQINLRKSKIYGVGVVDEEVQGWARGVGCEGGNLPFTYLGLPVGARLNKKAEWIAVVEKLKTKLATWKAKLISF